MPTGAASGPEVEQPVTLVPVAQLQALQIVLEETRRRERDAVAAAEVGRTEATQRTQALQEEIAKLQNQLGQAQGELSAFKALRSRPAWWRWLFGGE